MATLAAILRGVILICLIASMSGDSVTVTFPSDFLRNPPFKVGVSGARIRWDFPGVILQGVTERETTTILVKLEDDWTHWRLEYLIVKKIARGMTDGQLKIKLAQRVRNQCL